MRTMFAVFAAAMLASPAFAEDVSGSADHPVAPRFDGAEIRNFKQLDVAEMIVPVGPITDDEAPANVTHLQGAVTHIDYVIEPAVSALQLQQHYDKISAANGFEAVWSCDGVEACGGDAGAFILNSGQVAPSGFADGIFTDDLRVITARKEDTWITLHLIEGPDRALVYQAVVENAQIQTAEN